ncbi:hypothetical protein CTAM01_04813 [Colletotrichum tamarilloi]|uniref:Uncharacterized protein n=1 Tax=Colletotrichum tamarilloi TaxID=1209934 RepID=A0ABQ9RH76_9PEZI|nr:uncharacterized protein CTAM01_04813 [Colletotrichum tamarilloi]KAK1503501.1 hypothetical protein CTAM01_04813 [Colletotrichum tamarilloi]
MSIHSLYTSSRAPHNSHHPPPVTSSASTGAHRVWHPQTSISRQYLTAAHGIFRPGHLNPTKPGPLHLLQNPRGPTPVLEERSRTLRSKAWGWGAPPLLHISFRQWAELHFAFPHQDQKKKLSLAHPDPVAWELRPAGHLTLVRDDPITNNPGHFPFHL